MKEFSLIRRGTLIADQRRAGEARPKGKSRKRTEESLLSSRRFRLFPATGQISSNAAKQLNSISFHVTHRFFVTFFTEESNVTSPASLNPAPAHAAARRQRWPQRPPR